MVSIVVLVMLFSQATVGRHVLQEDLEEYELISLTSQGCNPTIQDCQMLANSSTTATATTTTSQIFKCQELRVNLFWRINYATVIRYYVAIFANKRAGCVNRKPDLPPPPGTSPPPPPPPAPPAPTPVYPWERHQNLILSGNLPFTSYRPQKNFI
eukprot:TRINITY_DN2389_c0_g1_i5.p3 TRINITY_DN2389_c0_g1~~TRINITY_DN2389_c0_g1_i5.p3  ORF type:complete len:155 (+),score=20.46 TRINITY_DN2389_c0_g1_i5:87-551(+)